MLDVIKTYFDVGFTHIFNIAAIDHILFLVALCALFRLIDWRKLLILVTAFTLGHSITLALVILDIIHINSSLVELLIPITILLTGLFNIYIIRRDNENFLSRSDIQYGMGMGFGLIHGMGFSNYLKSTLFPGENLFAQLFAFNVGLEIGQILIIALIMFVNFLSINVLKIKLEHWAYVLSGIAIAVSIYLIINQL